MSLRERTRPGLGIIEPPSPAKAPPSGPGWLRKGLIHGAKRLSVSAQPLPTYINANSRPMEFNAWAPMVVVVSIAVPHIEAAVIPLDAPQMRKVVDKPHTVILLRNVDRRLHVARKSVGPTNGKNQYLKRQSAFSGGEA
jgi:hypothetical protein